MKKTGTMVGLCLAMGLSTASFAGAKDTFAVYIDTASRFAIGSMGSARNSTDTHQNMYCYTNTSGYGYCMATDASGTSVGCSTSNANMLATIRSLNSDSYLQFFYDGGGYCTSILVGTGSHYEAKVP
jgi:hypothetical protein